MSKFKYFLIKRIVSLVYFWNLEFVLLREAQPFGASQCFEVNIPYDNRPYARNTELMSTSTVVERC